MLRKTLRMPEDLQIPKRFMRKWKELAEKAEGLRKDVRIALVGKYTKFQDAYTSVIKALNHAALAANRRLTLDFINAEDLEENMKSKDPVRYHDAWKLLCQCQGNFIKPPLGCSQCLFRSVKAVGSPAPALCQS